MSQIKCQVDTITPLAEAVFQVILTPEKPLSFYAGQYVLVHMGDNDKRPFSIANAAFDNHKIELHVGADENNAYATEVLDRMRNNGEISISGGHGEAYLQSNGKPIILIAGGTGFSYTWSILQQTLQDHPHTSVTLYWGGKNSDDLYLHDELSKLADEHEQFSFIPVIEFANDGWRGRTGWVHHAVIADYPSLKDTQVYIAGRFEMAKAARDDFTARELSQTNLFGDAYAFI
ncbi:NAD(P)H-flavin reductase [Alteromonas lipotrueiana]|uniref:NAD(P)H-flavin reductase n=1 Tax=Alteromonas lipotrueiana TaxID=2803815 RepID=UPI001C4614C6|nr:NAD(P)H-flavin reductase [Alteromonas lipotrueiana]